MLSDLGLRLRIIAIKWACEVSGANASSYATLLLQRCEGVREAAEAFGDSWLLVLDPQIHDVS